MYSGTWVSRKLNVEQLGSQLTLDLPILGSRERKRKAPRAVSCSHVPSSTMSVSVIFERFHGAQSSRLE